MYGLSLANPEDLFYDVKVFHEDTWYSITYRTGMTVYEEMLSDGFYCATGWNAAGYVPQVMVFPSVPRLNTEAFAEPYAFQLTIDGQQLHSHWQWEDFEQTEEERGLHVCVTLVHKIRPVRVKIHTFLDGTPVLTRWLEIENTGESYSAISQMAVMSGGVAQLPRHRQYLRENTPLYRLGYSELTPWGHEGTFRWHPLNGNSGTYFGGRFLRERHRHPMCILENNATGECYIAQLGYSGGYRFDFDLNENAEQAALSMKIAVDGFSPIRVLDPKDTTVTPKVHMGMVFGGYDNAVNEMNRHIRRSVLVSPSPLFAPMRSGLGPEMDMRQAAVLRQIDTNAKLEMDAFVIDAAWYSEDGQEENWLYQNGDWFPEKLRYEIGYDGLAQYCHDRGLLFGLWMEPERLGRDSKAFQEHPEFCTVGYDDKIRGGINGGGGILDISRDDAAKWVEEQMVKFVETTKIDYLRLDFNVGNEQTRAYTMRGGFLENSDYRYYENWYGIYRRLRERFPKLILENCASGGGRTDLGMMESMSHTQLSDWVVAPRSFAIINGMSMCLPPERMDHLVGGVGAHILSEIDFNLRLCLFSRPAFGNFFEYSYQENPLQMGRVRHCISLFRDFVRPMHRTGSKVYHHTPELDPQEPKGTGILEYTSADGAQAMLGVFQLSDPEEKELCVRFRGVNPQLTYRVTLDNLGVTYELTGHELRDSGIRLYLGGALTSELILAEAKGE